MTDRYAVIDRDVMIDRDAFAMSVGDYLNY